MFFEFLQAYAPLPDYSAFKADQSGRGAYACSNSKKTKKDIIKIGTADVVIQEDNKGPMIFGESANITKKEDTATIEAWSILDRLF